MARRPTARNCAARWRRPNASSRFRVCIAKHSELLLFELTFAKASDKPVILMRPFGANAVLPKEITSLSDQIVDWDGRALVDAVKAQARHEESNRWDTIEFKLD